MTLFQKSIRAALAAAFAFSAFPASAAVFTTYSNLTDFTNALGGAPTETQDFSGFATGTDLLGVSFLPGVTATTANDRLEVFGSENRMFSLADSGRSNPAYTLSIGNNFNAIGFNITSWNPDATGPLVLTILFGDADLQVFNLTRPPGAQESDPQFFGITSNVGISSIALAEPSEVPGTPGLEEVSLDDFVAAQVTDVPEPSTITVTALGLSAGLLLLRKKRYSGD